MDALLWATQQRIADAFTTQVGEKKTKKSLYNAALP